MKLLLHVCCAPCLIFPLRRLQEDGFKVAGFFYNPNIHPLLEYQRRRQALADFTSKGNVEVVYPAYIPSEFLQAVQTEEAKPQRCTLCWELRMQRTAEAAKDKGYGYFSTTLLVSPYQDQELLREIGSRAAADTGVNFYYQDFRPGFRQAHQEARAEGLYCQKYCGCLYSERERCRKSQRR